MFPYLFPLASPSLPPSLSHPSRVTTQKTILLVVGYPYRGSAVYDTVLRISK